MYPTVTVRLHEHADYVALRFILRSVQRLVPSDALFSRQSHYLHDRFANETIMYGHMLSQRFRGIAGVQSVAVTSDECIVRLRPTADRESVIERLRQNTLFVLRVATPWVTMRTSDGADWRYRFGTRLLTNGTELLSGAVLQTASRTNMTTLGRTLHQPDFWHQRGIHVNAFSPNEIRLAPLYGTPAQTDWPTLDTHAVHLVAHWVGARGIHVDWAQ